jgi:hypothetical protein
MKNTEVTISLSKEQKERDDASSIGDWFLLNGDVVAIAVSVTPNIVEFISPSYGTIHIEPFEVDNIYNFDPSDRIEEIFDYYIKLHNVQIVIS